MDGFDFVIKTEQDLQVYLEYVHKVKITVKKISNDKEHVIYDRLQVKDFYEKILMPALESATLWAEIVVRNPDFKIIAGEEKAMMILAMLKAWGPLGLKGRTKPEEAVQKLES